MAEQKPPELIKLSDFFTNYKHLYGFIILNPLQQYVNPSTGVRKQLAILSYWLVYASLFAFCGMQFIYLVNLIGDLTLTALIPSAVWLSCGFISLECVLFIWLKGERLTGLLGRLDASFPKTKELQEYGKLAQVHAEWNTISTVNRRIYLLVAINVMYFQPLAISLYVFLRNGTWFLRLPGLLWYPFDYEDNWNRVFAYIWEVWGFFNVTRSVLSVGILLGSITMTLCSQFKTLARECRELTPTIANFKADYKKLIELVRKHNYLTSTANELEDIFRVSLVINYAISSVVIGCLGFLILKEEQIDKKLEYIGDSCTFLSYAALIAFYGNRLIECVSLLI